jgi:transmembrane sensor
MTRSPTDIETAIEWLVRLQGDSVTEDDWRAFDAWLTVSPGNAEAYDAVLLFDQRLQLDAWLAEGEPLTAAMAAPAAPVRSARRVWMWSAGAAIAATFLAGAVLLPASGLMGGRETIYTTGVGERRTIALEDGSRIELNAASRLTVRFDRNARRVWLDDAQAFFDVAEDPARPFLIEAGDTRVRVVGTQFDVRRRDGAVAVAVQKGLVEVRSGVEKQATPIRLAVGQRLSHREGRDEGAQVDPVAVDEVTGWRQGRLIYRDRPLSEIVADLNRLFPKPVKLADARVADLRLSGVLIVDAQDAMVTRLSQLLPVRTTTTKDSIVIRAR